MTLDDKALLDASPAERDAWLADRATLRDATITAPVGGTIEIKRDAAGVPHIHAGTTPDLYFGLGFAMAQDRLWQMDRLRRRALGRQAEIMGPAYLASDIAHLTVGIDLMAMRDADAMDATTKAVVQAFVAGINRYIASETLPVEFLLLDYTPDNFIVRDVVAIARGIWWSLNGRIDRLAAAEAATLLPEPLRALYLTPEASENLVVPPDCDTGASAPAGTDDATGSNNWALSGSHTASGHALLCGDPHQPFWIPSSWYEFALHGPQDEAAGAGHPGTPGLIWGSNGAIAWGITNNMASTRDLYREEVNPEDPALYREAGEWRRFDERTVSIPVKGAEAHSLTIRSTIRGPVVNALLTPVREGGDPPLSMRWVGAEHLDDIRAMIAVPRARDWVAFRNALRDWAVSIFNFVYADRDGNIGYQMAGRIPRRGRITPGFRDPANPDDQWLGHIPFDDLPYSYNPPRGYVASANQRIVEPDDRRPIYGAYSQGHRGVRIDQMFAGGPKDRAENIAFQNDVKSCRAERLCPGLLGFLKEASDPESATVAAALTGWDYRYTTDSAAPTVFETFMALWSRTVVAEHLPARLLDLTSQQTNLASSLLEGAVPSYFPAGTAQAVAKVAKQAIARLTERLGSDAKGWNWGAVHVAHWRHPLARADLNEVLNVGPEPVDGGSHTVRNTGGELPPHAASSGAEYRMVMDFAEPGSFLAVQNIGNSGVPGSPHYRDQFYPWLRAEYHVVQLDWTRVEAVTTTRINPS